MAVDRVADFVLSGILDRFYSPDIVNYNGRRNGLSMDSILERDYTKDIIEVPSFCFADAVRDLESIVRGEQEIPITKVVNTIISDSIIMERKQLNTILKDFTMRNYDSRMAKVSNKGRIYYGFPGLVTDSAFNTIVCLKIRMKRAGDKLKVTNYICYVSPKVFSNQDGIVEKTVYKKIIPFCSTYVLHNNDPLLKFTHYNFIDYDWEGKHIEVIIRDGEECLFKPRSPKIIDFESDNLVRNMLIDNLDSLTI